MPENALIVDNDFFFVKFLGNLLRERGLDVHQAYDGKQGILALEDQMVDYIFVNILMPRIDGGQFIDFVREKYANKEFSIIGMSDSIIELRELQKEVGADYYLQKQPVERMAKYVDRFMEYVEGDPFLSSPNKDLFNHEKLFRRQATIDLLESLSFQQGIVESAGMGIIVAEKDARIVFVNRLGVEILNQPISKLLSSRITEVFPADEKKKILTGLKAVAKDTALMRQSFTIIMNNIAVQITVSILRVEGEIEGWVLILNNMDSLNEMR
ncbi:MAG: response regulator [Deltaproteobacteria bacterium]|nr:response regulator [Deltaproteobacteria bacterium]